MEFFFFVVIRSLRSREPKYSWQTLMTSILLVLNYTEPVYDKIERVQKFAFLSEQASRPDHRHITK